jgi:hypothetical protein
MIAFHLRRDMRYLEFPCDTSVGVVGQVDPDGSYRYLGPARGRIAIPPNARLDVRLSGTGWQEALTALEPHELFAVDMGSTLVEDQHLAHLARFTGLREVRLSKADRIGDTGIAHLSRLTSLRDLDLYRTQVTDAGLPALAGLASLEELHLGATRVRGGGIIALRHLPRLWRLILHDTLVDDVDVQDAAEIQSLRRLVVFNTRVTLHGACALRARRPALSVHGARKPEGDCSIPLLALFVHRLSPADRVHDASSLGEMAAALNRVLGRGAEIAAGDDDRYVAPAIDPDLINGEALDRFLYAQYGRRLQVRLPDGRTLEVPWLVKRGEDRRRERSDQLRLLSRRRRERRREPSQLSSILCP